ncbi:MAG: pentapeptide repeat-containing protein [Lachnotalea sp.]
MTKYNICEKYAKLQEKLKIDCKKCSGLCCVALFCIKSDGFPANKESGVPCQYLMNDFRCNIHSNLISKNMRGCLAYDCFGAGQKVTQSCYPNTDWKSNADKGEEIFQVFIIVYQLHQMEWYLIEALSMVLDENLKSDIESLISENEQMTRQSPNEILHLNIEKYRLNVNQKLKKVSNLIVTDAFKEKNSNDFFGKNFKCANLDKQDFSMAILIAANLEGCSLNGTSFLGADLRDTNIQNTDLGSSIFLTQMQINSAKGNVNTNLPKNLIRPASWQRL